jgi:penicillin-binding protein 1C
VTLRRVLAGTVFALCGVLLFLWIITIPPVLPSYGRTVAAWQPSESWLYDRNHQLIDSERVNFKARRLGWVPLSAIAKSLPQAVIASEDKRFLDHGGVDWLALSNALWARLSGETSRGASTISMQVAGFLAPELSRPGARSWRDKLRQLRAGSALEGSWSKDQILEAYFNLAPYHGEAQGIGAAALGLFGKTAATLSPNDSALLAALLPDPNARVDQIAARACRIRRGTCAGLRAAALAMLNAGKSLALDPGLAPHLATKLLTKPGMTLETTLDRSLQSLANEALRRQLLGLGTSRARDGAVIIVDNKSGDILAYVGGVGGGSTAAAVDGADAYRQAGSTLKPFLYGMVLEKGWLTPASILDDSPVQMDTASGLYVPQNYDHEFKGPVSVRTALAGSLNVPAVRTLVIAGTEPFRDRLWDTGYKGLTEDGQYYGFSLALGSAEVTLLEQVAAYRSLALGGVWSPLRIKSSDPTAPPRRTLSPQAAWLIGDILSDPAARAATFGLDSALKLPFWSAVKTGTSKAMRDNWCIGYSDRYTVGVWVGNLEGDSMKAVSGTSGAAPVWRDVMMALHAKSPGKVPPMPNGIETRTISFAAGKEPVRREYFLSGTGQSQQIAAPATARRPRITNPLSGSVFALDPDIPLNRQRMAITVTGEVIGHRLQLDRRDLGDAGGRPLILAGPGTHLLALLDPGGQVVDRARFTVR